MSNAGEVKLNLMLIKLYRQNNEILQKRIILK